MELYSHTDTSRSIEAGSATTDQSLEPAIAATSTVSNEDLPPPPLGKELHNGPIFVPCEYILIT
jgi:hypothetical protein